MRGTWSFSFGNGDKEEQKQRNTAEKKQTHNQTKRELSLCVSEKHEVIGFFGWRRFVAWRLQVTVKFWGDERVFFFWLLVRRKSSAVGRYVGRW